MSAKEITLRVVGGNADGGLITIKADQREVRLGGNRTVYCRRYVRCRNGVVEWLSPIQIGDKEALELLLSSHEPGRRP